jgi:hypothetical protein
MTTWHFGELPTPDGGARDHISSHVANFENTQHVFFNSGTQFYELWWRDGETAHQKVVGGGSGLLTSHVNEDARTQHLFFPIRGSLPGLGHNIAELSWGGGSPVGRGDLIPTGNRRLLAAPAPVASHVFNGTNHVFYRMLNKHVAELSWRGNEVPRQRELSITQNGAAPLAESDLSSYVFGADGTQHVFYNSGAHIIELSWLGDGGAPQWRDLNAALRLPGASPALGRPATHVFEFEKTQHVFYVADNGHIIELSWFGSSGAPTWRDLTTETPGGAPLAAAESVLVSHVANFENTEHVFYVTDDAHIFELWRRPGEAPHAEDLTKLTGAPPPSELETALLISHVFENERTQHLFYVVNTIIIELWSQP